MKLKKSPLFVILTLMLSLFSATTAFADELPIKLTQHYISWEFIAYDRPDFKAEKVCSYPPQAVMIKEKQDNGWALISTSLGDLWVYLNDNVRFIERRMAIYNNKGDEVPIALIDSQTASIIAQDKNWVQINTWLGAKWINLLYSPPIAELDGIIKKYGNTVSVYYENITTGYKYSYRGDTSYVSASVIKAPYCLYVYQLAEQGLADLSSQHTYRSGNYQGGTGVIKNMKVGTVLTEHQLLQYSVRNSDNIGIRMLSDKYGTDGFKNFIEGLGGRRDLVNPITTNVHSAKVTANECGIQMRAIYEYIEGSYTYSEQFKADLMSTSNPMIVSDFPIARKYGWANQSFHDTAIVYANSPYILVILSARENGTSKDFAAFRDISMAVQEFNSKYLAE